MTLNESASRPTKRLGLLLCVCVGGGGGGCSIMQHVENKVLILDILSSVSPLEYYHQAYLARALMVKEGISMETPTIMG